MPKNAATEFDSEYFEDIGAVLPCQLRPASSPLHARSGERLLMLAVLSDAINIFLKGATERRLLAETRSWICGGNRGGYAVSFENACDALGIDPTALRERLFRLKYADEPRAPAGRRVTLTIKPPAMSRGPTKLDANCVSACNFDTPNRGHRRPKLTPSYAASDGAINTTKTRRSKGSKLGTDRGAILEAD